jgi:energy-coupling factor transport system permease protein
MALSPALPRLLHPAAWWVWGASLAVAASRTTNPFLLVLIVAVAGWVVVERRELGSSDAFVPFLLVGLFAIGLRVVMVALLGGGVTGRTVIIRLPELPLPAWSGSLRLGGPVTAEGVLSAGYDGLRLAAILACLGATNALASPRRLLRYVPATLYEVGTALVVALTFAPQMVEDARRVRAARRLRGHTGNGVRELARLSIPVLVGALERSLHLAASMESRGYGRAVRRTPRSTRLGAVLTLVGLLGVVLGLYGMLDATSPVALGLPTLVGGVLCATAALAFGARRDPRSRYRRDPWSWPEWLVVAVGLVPAAVLAVASVRGWDGLVPQQVPAVLPSVPVGLVLAILTAGLAAVVAPVPPRAAAARATRSAQAAQDTASAGATA